MHQDIERKKVEMRNTTAKQTILEFLDFLRFKVENDNLTCEEVESIAKVLQANLTLMGTADDFATFYGKTKTNVTTVIDRKMTAKPKRMLMYSWKEFRQVIPESWVHK